MSSTPKLAIFSCNRYKLKHKRFHLLSSWRTKQLFAFLKPKHMSPMPEHACDKSMINDKLTTMTSTKQLIDWLRGVDVPPMATSEPGNKETAAADLYHRFWRIREFGIDI